MSIQIHKINANVSAITKLVDLLGSPKDTPDLRNKLSVGQQQQQHSPPHSAPLLSARQLNSCHYHLLCRHNLTDATRDVVKDSTADVKRFANWDVSTSDVSCAASFHAPCGNHSCLCPAAISSARTAKGVERLSKGPAVVPASPETQRRAATAVCRTGKGVNTNGIAVCTVFRQRVGQRCACKA